MKIDINKNVRVIEIKDYLAGPLNGICTYRGEKYWFEGYLDYSVNYTDSKGKEKSDVVRAFCAIKVNKFLINYIIFGKKLFRKLVLEFADKQRRHIAFKLWHGFFYYLFNINPKGKPAFAFYWTELDGKTGELLGNILTPKGAFNIKKELTN